MTANIGMIDRVLRLILGFALVVAPFIGGFEVFASQGATIAAVIVGIVLIATAGMRFCPLYRLFGIRTCSL